MPCIWLDVILKCVFCYLYSIVLWCCLLLYRWHYFKSVGTKVWINDNVGISMEEIVFSVWFTRLCIDASIFPSCETILSSTNHSYSCKERWLGCESGRRSCHKEDSKVLMIMQGTNLMGGSSREDIVYRHKCTTLQVLLNFTYLDKLTLKEFDCKYESVW